MSHVSSNIIDRKFILASISMFPESRNPKYENKRCHLLFSPSKWPTGCHFMECCCNYTNAKNDSCFNFVSIVVFSCVAANVCYFFECYSIICYVDERHTYDLPY